MTAPNQTVRASAPGRVELLGNHTDYNEGVVLAAAIDRGLAVSGHAREDGMISLRSSSMGQVAVPLRGLQPQIGAAHWANYVLGVVSEFVARGISVPGFSVEVDGDLPPGNGLSSSAALEVATAFFLQKLCPARFAAMEIAKMCQRAEEMFTGVRSGLLDQVTSIFGKANHAVFFDARSEEVRAVPFPADFALVVAQTGAPRALAAGKYNERRAETRAAAQALGVSALRAISSAEIAARPGLPELSRRRALHVVTENERVWLALELLDRGDGPGFGLLMNQSHESSRVNFENSTAELDQLVEAARQLPGVLGSRLTGGGFGGATISLCERSRANEIAASLTVASARQTGITAPAFVCQLSDGAA
ncbi:MAG: galactokinase [Verrucomicrobiota bacterium]|nr:galactokinase [Verrucomicrobiota bacterium]